ncbi:MAG TPA: GGDEF domain-containing protein [Gammaproteobacteria bacterium]|nr:GGDEF domain-containing protein [Gammaproteobacteria bacterium]
MERRPVSVPRGPFGDSSAGEVLADAQLLEGEQRVFERMAAGAELKPVLEEIALLCERHSQHLTLYAVLLANDTGDRLDVVAAPSLPPVYASLADGTPVNADSNPCGVAAWSKQAVMVEDFAVDPRWTDIRADAETLGLRAGWSLPILSQRGRLLGTFAAYSREPARPAPKDVALMERFAHIARIAIEKHHAERTIERMTNYDGLTGLPNRTLLLDHLDEQLLRGHAVGVLLFNLDSMKQINDTLGYEFGNRCIQAVAKRLEEHHDDGGLVARVGGDEFGMVFGGPGIEGQLEKRVRSLLDEITQPLNLDDRTVFITASAGVSIGPRDGGDADSLFKHADVALHIAKQRGRNGFQVFDPSMSAPAARRVALLGALRHALERHEFHVYYQPQVDVASGEMSGAEALLRWKNPEQGEVAPGEFIPLLEETGLILSVGEWVLDQVCRDLVTLQEAGVRPPRLAVNLSARQFTQPDLASRIEAALERHGVSPDFLTLEITETLLMRDPADAQLMLQRLKDVRVKIALDDFGTGYSSLAYLKRFPVDELKIDKSFVSGVTQSTADAAITDTVIRLAHNLGMRVLAEGVEHEAQRAFLEVHGCDRMQGYLTGRPMDVATFRARIEAAAHAQPERPSPAPGVPAAR